MIGVHESSITISTKLIMLLSQEMSLLVDFGQERARLWDQFLDKIVIIVSDHSAIGVIIS